MFDHEVKFMIDHDEALSRVLERLSAISACEMERRLARSLATVAHRLTRTAKRSSPAKVHRLRHRARSIMAKVGCLDAQVAAFGESLT